MPIWKIAPCEYTHTPTLEKLSEIYEKGFPMKALGAVLGRTHLPCPRCKLRPVSVKRAPLRVGTVPTCVNDTTLDTGFYYAGF